MTRNVPDAFKESLELLAQFSDSDMASILSALEEREHLESREAIRAAFYLASESVTKSALRELSTLVMAFARVNLDQRDTAKETFEELSLGPNLDLEDHQRSVLKDRLVQIAAIPGLMSASQASYEERNHERLLTQSGVETDLRPLFDQEGKPTLVVPWHTLNLRFTSRQYDDDQSESVVMDHLDLIQLREQIDEALEGRLKIQADFTSRGIHIWEPYVPNALEEEE